MPLNPPNIIARPLSGSVNPIGPVAAGGDVAGLSCVQVRVRPSQLQVSPRYCEPEYPPNITSRCVGTSKAIAAAARAGGDCGEGRSVHVKPSKVQVSLK